MKIPKTVLDLSNFPAEYHPILQNPRFTRYLHLLSDNDLAELMKIEYSEEIAQITQKAEPQSSEKSDAQKIKQAIAEELDIPVIDLKPENFTQINDLDLDSLNITDISLLKDLKNLRSLKLIDNQISDLSPLKGLKNLTSLAFSGNQVSDLSPLKGLANLNCLDLNGNQVSNLSPLKGLKNLASLYFFGNQVSDLSPLEGLKFLN